MTQFSMSLGLQYFVDINKEEWRILQEIRRERLEEEEQVELDQEENSEHQENELEKEEEQEVNMGNILERTLR